MQAFRAYGEWVLIQADPRVKKTAGGIILTDELTQIEKLMEGSGRVLSIGHLVAKTCASLSLGDRVCYRGYLKDVHKIGKSTDGCDQFLLHHNDVLIVIDDSTKVGAFS